MGPIRLRAPAPARATTSAGAIELIAQRRRSISIDCRCPDRPQGRCSFGDERRPAPPSTSLPREADDHRIPRPPPGPIRGIGRPRGPAAAPRPRRSARARCRSAKISTGCGAASSIARPTGRGFQAPDRRPAARARQGRTADPPPTASSARSTPAGAPSASPTSISPPIWIADRRPAEPGELSSILALRCVEKIARSHSAMYFGMGLSLR